MKILISVDIEGVAGVSHSEQVRSDNPEYEQARRWMTAEANAAIDGAFAGGATEVLVNDSHGSFRNLILQDIDARAHIITGKPRYLSMMSGVEQQCQAVFMVGYHAKSQEAGVLAHTINSFAFRHIRINGQALGEAGLYGALAGEYHTPVALITGDDQFIAETAPLFDQVKTAQTKVAHGFASCTSLSPKAACERIRQAAYEAMAIIPKLRPVVIAAPIVCEIETQTPGQADLFAQWPTVERVSSTTLRVRAASMYETIRILNCFSAMSFMLR